ncbi:nucleotide pyrophosphatase [Candidatus Acidianus copahuensis]|uniref:Nucleotide pyrophosphatase n=1 Tax=Candidatus Acidianus copahuensis TaxID=1160895 RepID=A0A031LNY4_9CREN|nr:MULTISPECIES: alkaline phosphatase family protein [Acidianus]EZQ03804.1 nucleotide pyrophosphatase [Candidatus Acidianus copahuensis]NON61444.1 nucleotide pyrophosphatase [Acidianus sp. RZ1]
MKVILTIIDGMAFHLMERFSKDLTWISKLITEGSFGRLESSYPSITPVALASLYTGLLPKNNGVVSSKIHVKGKKLSNPISAFSSSALLVEPIWTILAKKGFNVLVSSAPQALPDKWKKIGLTLFDPYRTKIKRLSKGTILKEGENNSYGIMWKVSDKGNFFEIEIGNNGDKSLLNKQTWSSPIEFTTYLGNKEIKGVTILHARENEIYVSPPGFLTEWGNNSELLNKIWSNVIIKTGILLDGDYKSLNAGLITFEEYIRTAELSFNFFMEYTKFLLENASWDFAITYLPTVDNFQHLLYGVNDDNARKYIFKAYTMADEFIGVNSNYADIIFICSDHGIAKVKEIVYINKILEKINIVKRKNEHELDWKRTKALYTGGGTIRVNLRGREDNGIVKPDEYPKLVNYIVKNLENVVNDEGKKVFMAIYQNQIPAGDREGDIKITANEGFSISANNEKEVEIENVLPYRTITADHGYYRREDLYGVVIAYGKGISKNSNINAKIIDITPTILKIFGIQNNKTDGRILSEVFKD